MFSGCSLPHLCDLQPNNVVSQGWLCSEIGGYLAAFINKICFQVVAALRNYSRFAFLIQCICKYEPQKKHRPCSMF